MKDDQTVEREQALSAATFQDLWANIPTEVVRKYAVTARRTGGRREHPSSGPNSSSM